MRRSGPPAAVLLSLLGLILASAPGRADDIGDLRTLVARHAPEGRVPEASRLREACTGDLRCAAEAMVAAWPEGVRLQAIPEADPRLVRSGVLPRSVTGLRRVRPGVLRLRLERFGRGAGRQVAGALAGIRDDERLELDLRHHRGGSVGSMLDVASLFIGPEPQAMRIVGRRAVVLGVPAPAFRANPAAIDVLIGPETRSSAEVLAALLHRYAGARLVGERTFGKNWAERPVKLGNGWYLMVRAGEILVDGEVLEGGLAPDVPSGS